VITGKAFQCEIYSPEGKIFEGEATKVIATAVDGELGVLYNHAPLVTALGEGTLRITSPDGETAHYTAFGGFLEVVANHMTILTDRVEEAGSEAD